MSADLNGIFVIEQNQYTQEILTPECLQFVATLHRQFNPTRKALLRARKEKALLVDRGMPLTFPPETKHIREGDWKVAPPPKDVERRWIEITGPPNPKLCLNAMNSGADVFMADFEDALAPTWINQVSGQKSLLELNKKELLFSTKKGKDYKLDPKSETTLFVRPRGWHLDETHLVIDGEPCSASIFDFAVYFFHNVRVRLANGCGGIYYYLPKIEAYRECRLWNDVFVKAQQLFSLPISTIRCTVLIETLGGGLEMEEFLYELKDHIVGLNAGRWDYIFSAIKILKNYKQYVLPDRSQVTMTVPFMRAYTNRLIQVCHKRGAHAIGGMSAFIPVKDKAQNEIAFNKITEDKTREVTDGFDGSWVAHPGMALHARKIFEKYLNGKANQKHVMREDVKVTAEDITNLTIDKPITEAGVRGNINVAIQYTYYWITGTGAVGLHNLMEDAATAEISRSQLWQWIRYRCTTDNGVMINEAYYRQVRDEEVAKLRTTLTNAVALNRAIDVIDKMVLDENFYDFLTSEAYPILNNLNVSQVSAKL